MRMPPLLAVIGPVEPHLLRAWAAHYRGQGYHDFLLAFHFTDDVTPENRQRLFDICDETLVRPLVISQGPWHEMLHGELRDHLRRRAGDGWHAIADSDEFHSYPQPVPDLIASAEAAGRPVVGGVLFDRVAKTGEIRSWTPAEGLDDAFPLGGFLTANLIEGNPCKMVLAHSSMRLSLGSHRCLDADPVNDPLVPVHHFKWRAGVLDDLSRRISEHASGRWDESSPAIRTEASTLLDHLAGNRGMIDVMDSRLGLTPAALGELPAGWRESSAEIFQRYGDKARTSVLPEGY